MNATAAGTLLRPATELVAAAAWFAAAAVIAVASPIVASGLASSAAFIVVVLALGAVNAVAGARTLHARARLLEHGLWRCDAAETARQVQRAPGAQWLGRGFDWTPLHTQQMSTLLATDPATIAPPRWMQALHRQRTLRRGASAGAPAAGAGGGSRLQLIRGVASRWRPVHVALTALSSHTLVFGQTGTGKTRLAELVITSFLARHHHGVVFVIDPKGDRALRATLESACRRTGRAGAFLSLHPAFPAESIRFDPLRNFARTTSIATRIATLLPAADGGDAFSQFAWRALHRVADAMVYAGVQPSLLGLRRCLEDDARPLLARALDVWAAAVGLPAARPAGAAQMKPAGAGGVRSPALSADLAGAVARYRALTGRGVQPPVPQIDALLSLVQHDPTHFSKMIQNLLPLLTALTAGALGPLLSPDAAADDETRPLFDARTVIDEQRCLYIGLDSLTDATVGSAIGAITLADLAQVAGERFNRPGGESVPVLVFVDEAAEVVTAPLIQLLNKARGAGFTLYLASQTVHDYEARLGSAAAARMLLGNPGNLIALRTADVQTQRFCLDSVEQTEVEVIGETRVIGLPGAVLGDAASRAIGSRRERREAPLFAPQWLGLLPDLHYFARIAGGRAVLGELPLLADGGGGADAAHRPPAR
jgi:conjugal transfer pilus assembly protein TraD